MKPRKPSGRPQGRPHDRNDRPADRRNDRQNQRQSGRPPSRNGAPQGRDEAPVAAKDQNKSKGLWLYGLHAVTAALENPERRGRRLVASDEAWEALVSEISNLPDTQPGLRPEKTTREAISQLLPPGAVHQGVALLADPLPDTALEDVLIRLHSSEKAVVLVLDQVTDPQNVGAILRSAAAFDVAAVVVPDRHAPPETAAMAKAASGALELVPLVRVVNLSRALEQLKAAGFWVAGLAGEAQQTLADADLTGKIALALGAEGEGLRRLTRDHCDILARLPISPRMESLNVSAAAAVALYELARKRG